ncbi:MAG TPA: rod shape-determining protein MreC [Candidatus Dormibacteraeota bacterium]|nr:rod shape-determining protein MreC [Candidatus Dormibacteraeota bacterium]
MVPIYTSRGEGKLLAVIAAVILLALVALLQIDAARKGQESLLSQLVTTVAVPVETAFTTTAAALHNTAAAVVDVPRLSAENVRLRAEVRRLRAEDAALREAASVAPQTLRFAQRAATLKEAIPATVIGYDPAGAQNVVTINRGSRAGVVRDAGVVNAGGVVGRVAAVAPFSAKILLITDYTSSVPAVVQQGRWWGIVRGSQTRAQMTYISQDATLKKGMRVVTGRGSIFPAGLLIGHITAVIRSDASLYQVAKIEPSAGFGRLSRVLVLPKPGSLTK